MKFTLLLLSATLLVAYSKATFFSINNTYEGSIRIFIQQNPGKGNLTNETFKLAQGESKTLFASDDWAGRFWARPCYAGDCGNIFECNGAGSTPPATLIEFILKGYGTSDYYGISLVDGYNIMASVVPINGQCDGSENSCKKAQCANDINRICPSELQVLDQAGSVVIACNSACNAFHKDEYCCSGQYSTPEICRSSNWTVDYTAIFKGACPDAHNYAYDDHQSTFSCQAAGYTLNFGTA